VRELGAVGDGQTDCTGALQRAIDACAAAGGGTIAIPAGSYVTGTLWLASNLTIHLEAGATLLGSLDRTAYPLWVSDWEGPAVARAHAPLIAGSGLSNIALTGRGTIDGRGQMWWDLFAQGALTHRRPNLVQFVDCKDVLIDGPRFINSPRWTLVPMACDNVTITRVTLCNPADSPNTDGINPDSCSNVHISNCHIDVGDDCISIKSGSEEDGRARLRPCQNITISNCTMLHGHGGVVIGSEVSGGVRNVAISNCVFCGTDRGIRLKSRRGRGNAVEDLRVDNIVMDQVLCPIVLNLFYGCDAWEDSKVTDRSPRPVDAGTPHFRRMRFSNISARGVKYAAAFVLGLPEMFVDDVTFDGMSIYLDAQNTHGGSPAMAPGVPDMCRAGLVIRNARNLRLRHVDIHDQLGPAVVIHNSADVVVDDLSAKRDAEAPLATLDDQDLVDGLAEQGVAGRGISFSTADRPMGRRHGRVPVEVSTPRRHGAGAAL
jgi:polygalacturonase